MVLLPPELIAPGERMAFGGAESLQKPVEEAINRGDGLLSLGVFYRRLRRLVPSVEKAEKSRAAIEHTADGLAAS